MEALQSKHLPNGDIRIIHPRKRRLPNAARLERILEKVYGWEAGCGHTDDCLQELMADVKAYCHLTGRHLTNP